MQECSSRHELAELAINSSHRADFFAAALVEAPDVCQPSPLLFD